MMKAVILAGGQDIGKCPLSLIRPRPLFPMPNGVLLQNLLKLLHTVDVGEAIICANGKTHILREHFTAEPRAIIGLDFHEDKLPRGAAGCLRDVAGFLEDETFLVLEGSLFLDSGIAELIDEHRRRGAALTVGAVPAANWQAGNGTEPLQRRLAPVGVYVVEPHVLRHIPDSGYYDIKEQLIPALMKQETDVSVVRFTGKHRRIADASSYATFMQEVLSGAFGSEHFSGLHEVAPHVWAASGAVVHPSATIIGPAVIGPHATIGKNTTIIGPSVVGEGVSVADQTFISGSILWNGASVGQGASVQRSIITDSFRVRENSRLSCCVAIARDLNLGEMHGLRQGGYEIGHSRKSVLQAVSDFCRSLASRTDPARAPARSKELLPA